MAQMAQTESAATPHAATRKTLVIATAASIAVAAILLVTVILPAEYGIDPLGTGRLLGVTALSGAQDVSPASGGPVTVQPASYKVDAIELTLRPGDSTEYKYQLHEGATMLYAWTATGPVDVDFHTEPDGKPEEASDSFVRQQAVAEGRGSYRAPYAGIHGWYWKNNGSTDVTVTLQTAGFYSTAVMFAADGSREPIPVSDPPTPDGL